MIEVSNIPNNEVIEDMEFAPCPRCSSTVGEKVFEGRDYLQGIKGAFFAWQCSACGLQYQNPRPRPDQLSRLYPSDYVPHQVGPIPESRPKSRSSPRGLAWLKWRYSVSHLSLWVQSLQRRSGIGMLHPTADEMRIFLSNRMGYSHLAMSESHLAPIVIRECQRLAGIDLHPHFVPEGRLLEIGCATGARLDSYRELGWRQLSGIELVENPATQARAKGFEVISGQVESALDRFPDEYFDVIVSSMVLEHLYDPFSVVRAIARKLKPGAEFLFSTVVRDALDARLFGKYWSGYDFPRHMVYFSLRDIEAMLKPDFQCVEKFHQNAPIDFLRPAVWRKPENRMLDRIIERIGHSTIAPILGEVLSRAGQTCRISFRCRRK